MLDKSLLNTVSSDVIRMVLMALEGKQNDLLTHSIRVSEISVILASRVNRLCLSFPQIKDAALLHDIGKLYVPSAYLDKPGALMTTERDAVEEHSKMGAKICLSLADPNIRNYAYFVKQHHEKADGSGYPYKLTLDAIAMESRIISVADMYSALTERRSYRQALEHDSAMDKIHQYILDFFGAEAHKIIDALWKYSGEEQPQNIKLSPVYTLPEHTPSNYYPSLVA